MTAASVAPSTPVWPIIISSLLAVIAAGGGIMWDQQRREIDGLRQEVAHMHAEIGQLQGKDELSQLDRDTMRQQLHDVTARQGRVIGVLSALAPNTTSSILNGR